MDGIKVNFMPFTCCICGKRIKNEWGHNPWPIKDKGECCSKCNEMVIAERILRLYEK